MIHTKPFTRRNPERGYSLVETIAVGAILMLGLCIALPALATMQARAQRTSATGDIKRLVWMGRMRALQQRAAVGIHFKTDAAGITFYQLFQDGNANGVLALDRARGIDFAVGAAEKVFAGNFFHPSLPPSTAPAIPPQRGRFTATDAITLVGDTLTFSPGGTFSNGSIYLGDGREFLCLRLSGSTGRVRVFRWKPGQAAWTEVGS